MLKKFIFMILALISVFVLISGQDVDSEDQTKKVIRIEIDPDVKMGMLKMYEEEKLARDTYLEFAQLWNLNIFKNLAKSEKRHMHAIEHMLNTYHIDTGDLMNLPDGEYSTVRNKKLYANFISKGAKSSAEALAQGALLEEIDITDLRAEIAKECAGDLNEVYKNLLAASENHLRACVRVLNRRSVTYSPQILTEDYFDNILSGSYNEPDYAKSCNKCEDE